MCLAGQWCLGPDRLIGELAESQTGPNFGHSTFNCNISSSFTKKNFTIMLDLPIHGNPVNGLMLIFGFYG